MAFNGFLREKYVPNISYASTFLALLIVLFMVGMSIYDHKLVDRVSLRLQTALAVYDLWLHSGPLWRTSLTESAGPLIFIHNMIVTKKIEVAYWIVPILFIVLITTPPLGSFYVIILLPLIFDISFRYIRLELLYPTVMLITNFSGILSQFYYDFNSEPSDFLDNWTSITYPLMDGLNFIAFCCDPTVHDAIKVVLYKIKIRKNCNQPGMELDAVNSTLEESVNTRNTNDNNVDGETFNNPIQSL
ncbi:hypothetical protein K502DRAFT_345174 [Neoconidiobolus thromboides FSU 785]|nr:hypothetical protein K502DRAFT_345174 [Neoconidiobolus thromboides FSU 785]